MLLRATSLRRQSVNADKACFDALSGKKRNHFNPFGYGQAPRTGINISKSNPIIVFEGLVCSFSI